MANNYFQTLMDPVSQGPDSPYGVKSSREYAAALLKGSQQPVAHWAQGIGNIVKALQGGYTEYKAGEQEQTGQKRSIEAMLAALGINNPTQPMASPMGPTAANATPMMDATAGMPDMQKLPQASQFSAPPQTNPMLSDLPTASGMEAFNQPSIQGPQANAQANLPRGLRNNNPGNIEDGPFAKNLPGYIGSDGRFARFASLDDGNAAIEALLKSYGNRGFNTPNAITNRWAPPSDNNPTQAYANNVAKALGVDVNAPLDMNNQQTLAQIRSAITRQENGPVASLPQGPVSAAPVSAGVVPSSPAATPPINRQALSAVLLDPWSSPEMKAIVLKQLGPRDPIAVPEGTSLVDPRTMQPMFQNPKNKATHGVVGQDEFGKPIYGWTDPNNRNTPNAGVSPTSLAQPQTAPAAVPPNAAALDANSTQVRPIPQGADPKKWREQETERIAKITGSRPLQVQGANIVIQDIDRALDNITKNPISTTGLIGKGLSYIGGTKSADLDSLLTTIKSNAGFDKLQAMRNASPTGGALGNVSNEENKLLAAAIGALEQSQSPQQLQDNLRRVKNIYSDIIHGHGNGPKREVLSFEQQSQQSPQGGGPQVGQIINGYRYKGGNPNDQSSYEKVQ